MDQTTSHLEKILAEAVEIPSLTGREEYLDRACAGDTDLRAKVERLIAYHFSAGSFLGRPAAVMETAAFRAEGDLIGTRIGPYKLLEQIGEGGMGLVYVAEQQEPVRRTVALKLIKPGMDSKQVIARFEAERQALALMDYPNIAKILDAGTTEGGRPYFVMELVRGIPITEYCDQARLTVRQRLDVFVQVCRAVQHAHTKGVIHRDIKPSNVLVTSYDGVPTPMIIDFGVAKALGQQLTELTLHTAFAQMVGTPLYMSPEQAEYNQLGVDTRSDIYSLGVMLYELLTGATPFDRKLLQTAAFDEMRRILREEEPPRPSARLSTMGDGLSSASQMRRLDPRKLTQTLNGELDWIVLRSMEKERSRRYETASAFASDIDRYLKDEQVEACPPSAGYRLRKYARRNKRLLAALGTIGIVLVAATAFSTWKAIEANAARKLADERLESEKKALQQSARDAATAQAVNRFLQEDLLGKVNLFGNGANGNPNLTVKEALDRAATKIGERFQNQPLVEASIRRAIGEAYHSLHVHPLAVTQLERAVALQKIHLGPEESETLDTMRMLCIMYSCVGRHADATTLQENVVATLRKTRGPDHPETLTNLCGLANTFIMGGNWTASISLLEEALEKRKTIFGLTSRPTLVTMHDLARTYRDTDQFEESMALHETTLTLMKSVGMGGDLQAIWCRETYAFTCQYAGKYAKSEQLLREAIEEIRKTEDSVTRRAGEANAAGYLARNFYLQKRFAEAEPFARGALAYFDKDQPDSDRRFYWMSLLGGVLSGLQKYKEAEPLLLQGYETLKKREAILTGNKTHRLAEAGDRIVRFYEATNQPEKARIWRDKLAPK